jgi:DNA-binding MarR family transcriptional regulator
MSQLAVRVVLSRSGVTRLIDRLVADGFVERGTCLEDARGAEAVLTLTGLDRLRAAGRTHLRGIEQYFLSTIPADDLSGVERTLGRVADRAGPGWVDPESCAVDAADEPARPLAATAGPGTRSNG